MVQKKKKKDLQCLCYHLVQCENGALFIDEWIINHLLMTNSRFESFHLWNKYCVKVHRMGKQHPQNKIIRRAFSLLSLWVGCEIIQENIQPTRHQQYFPLQFPNSPVVSQQGDACLSSRIELGPPSMRMRRDGYALHEPCGPPICPGPQG